MVYPQVSDKIDVPGGTPNGTLFVSVDGTWKKKGMPANLEDCARGYWTEANLAASHGEDCDWLMDEEIKDRFIGKIVYLGRCPNSLRGYFASK